jgi:anti-anti-sigma factor
MVISSRTPEGRPNECPICGAPIRIEPSEPSKDAPCPDCGHLVWFTWNDGPETLVIKLTGPLVQADDLEALATRIADRAGIQLRIDLSDVPYLSSAALGKLIKLKRQVSALGGKLKIRNPHPDLVEVFQLTGLDRSFDID